MPVFSNINGAWRRVTQSHSNINGTWRRSQPSCNINGIWRTAYTSITEDDVSWIEVVFQKTSSAGNVSIRSGNQYIDFYTLFSDGAHNPLTVIGNVVLSMNNGERLFMSGGGYSDGSYDGTLNAYATDRISTETSLYMFVTGTYLTLPAYIRATYVQGIFGRDSLGLAVFEQGNNQFGLPMPTRDQFTMNMYNTYPADRSFSLFTDNRYGGKPIYFYLR